MFAFLVSTDSMMESQSNHQTLGFEIGSTKVEPPSFLTASNSTNQVMITKKPTNVGFFVMGYFFGDQYSLAFLDQESQKYVDDGC